MKRLSWKYLAGLIDGEGCIDMQTNKVALADGTLAFYIRPRLRITLSGKAGEMVLPMLEANFGGHFDKDETFPEQGWQPAHRWALTGKAHLRSVLQNLVNHMIIKKEQARFSIWWLDNIKGGNQYGKQITEEVRRFAHDELKAMKKDPQRLSERASAEIQRMMRKSSTEESV